MGRGVYKVGMPINQQPFLTPEGVIIIGLNEDFVLKRSSLGYFIKRRSEQGAGRMFDPEAYLDCVDHMTSDTVEDGYEERQLAGDVWLRKRPQIVSRVVNGEVVEANVGIYSLIDKGDFLPDEISTSIKRVIYPLARLARMPEEFLTPAPFRTQVPMFAGGKTVRAGQKMN